MKPPVTGLLCEPSMAITLPCWTVTDSVHASGQSSGQAESTTEAGPPSGPVRCRELAGELMFVRYHLNCRAEMTRGSAGHPARTRHERFILHADVGSVLASDSSVDRGRTSRSSTM